MLLSSMFGMYFSWIPIFELRDPSDTTDKDLTWYFPVICQATQFLLLRTSYRFRLTTVALPIETQRGRRRDPALIPTTISLRRLRAPLQIWEHRPLSLILLQIQIHYRTTPTFGARRLTNETWEVWRMKNYKQRRTTRRVGQPVLGTCPSTLSIL